MRHLTSTLVAIAVFSGSILFADASGGGGTTPGGSGSPDSDTTEIASRFIRGDTNRDGSISVNDTIEIAQFISSGYPRACLDAADANDDGSVDVSDISFIVRFVLGMGPPPPPPFETCGPDPTERGGYVRC